MFNELPHMLAAVPDEAPMATHVVAPPPPQHVPAADHHALQASPMMLNPYPAPATGLRALQVVDAGLYYQAPPMDYQATPTTDVGHFQAPLPIDAGQCQAPPTTGVKHYQAPLAMHDEHYLQAPAMDIQPPQMQAPSEQAYVFPPERPLLPATGTGVDYDALPSFEGMLHGAPAGTGSPLLCDQLVNDGLDELAALLNRIEVGNATGGDAVAEREVQPDVRPVKEDNIIFVPLVRGQLDCTKCCTIRELLHESGILEKRASIPILCTQLTHIIFLCVQNTLLINYIALMFINL
jgi:hypothetical protein